MLSYIINELLRQDAIADLWSQTRVSALDIEELLHANIRTEPSFGDAEAIL